MKLPTILLIAIATSSCWIANAADDVAWTALAGYKTKIAIISEGPAGNPTVEAKDTVTVHATGIVKESNKKFWSTKDAGQQPFTYTAGIGGVITGWDQGCLGMQIGETRKLVIPAHEGYGANGFPAWGIPPGGTLDFTLECLSIQ